jgi:rhodanese-related sulfurtransferase
MKTFRSLLQMSLDACGFLVLLTAALCIGLLVNQFRNHPLPLTYVAKAGRVGEAVQQIQFTAASAGAGAASPAASRPEAVAPQIISLDDFRQHVERKDGLILDARPEVFHRLGHIPGALSFPREDFAAAYAKMRSRFDGNKGQLILVYCSGISCEDSQMVADGLAKLGYRRIFIFKGGWDEWTGSNQPEEKAE